MILILGIAQIYVRADLAARIDPRRAETAGVYFNFDFFRTLPGWMKWIGYALFGYFIVVIVIFHGKTSPNDPFREGGPYIPAAVMFPFSCGWMCGFWFLLCQFWQGAYSNRN
jgi:hypothetical protein